MRWKRLAHPLPAGFSQLKHLPHSDRLTREIDPETRKMVYRAIQLGACVIRDYEQWILQTQGKTWREQALSKRPERSFFASDQMPQAWDHFVLAFAQLQGE